MGWDTSWPAGKLYFGTLGCCRFQSCTPRPQGIQQLPRHPTMGTEKAQCPGAAVAEEKHLQREGIRGENPGKSGKRKSDYSVGIKDNSFFYCSELSVSLKVISEVKTVSQTYSITFDISKFWFCTASRCNIKPKCLWRRKERWQQHILLKDSHKYTVYVFKEGIFPTCDLKLLQIHLFGLPDLGTVSLKCTEESLNAQLKSTGRTCLLIKSITARKSQTSISILDSQQILFEVYKENNPALNHSWLLVSHAIHLACFSLLDTVLGKATYSVLKMLQLNFTRLTRQSPSVKRKLKIAKQLW